MAEKGFDKALEGEEEVKITFAKKDGSKRTIPIWFTLNRRTVELLPMYGSKTKWYGHVASAGTLQLKVRGEVMTASPRTVRDPKAIDEIKGRFSMKYGEGQVKKYYPTCDVAFLVPL